MKKAIRFTTSFVLALCTAFSSVTFSYAHKADAEELSEADALTTTEKVERIPVSKDSIPEYLDVKSLIADGFTTRIKSDEQSLGEVVFENAEGIRSLYIFDENVKFYDENGDIKDKSNKVVRKNNTFVSESNDIEAVLPVSIMSGISLKDDSLDITMRPVSVIGTARLNSVGQIKDEKSVLYENVFDEFTDVKYTFTYSGIKEDIILEKYNGVSSFNFEVSTGGLSLTEEKGALILRDENGEAKAVMDEVVVFSADNKNNTFGEYTVKEKVKNSLYTITISVDSEYLTDPDTAYPVTIDPNLGTISTSSNIQDMQVFKGADGTGTTETSAGLSGVSRVGWTDWGACRTLMKLDDSVFENNHIVNSWQVMLAKVQLRDLMCQSVTTSIACAQFSGNKWSESDTKTWIALNAGASATAVATTNVTYSNGATTHEWTITSLVQNWAANTENRSRGMVFKTASTSHESSSSFAQYMKTFSSMQGNASYKPCINIWYKFIGCKEKRIIAEEDIASINCQAYAFFLNNDMGFYYDYFGGDNKILELARGTVANSLSYTKEKVELWMDDIFGEDNWRQIIDATANPAYKAALYDDEWLVCMRVGIGPITSSASNVRKVFDYHFWYRANDGTWYDKHGYHNGVSVASREENPSEENDANGWDYVGNAGKVDSFYNSETIYYAIKQP